MVGARPGRGRGAPLAGRGCDRSATPCAHGRPGSRASRAPFRGARLGDTVRGLRLGGPVPGPTPPRRRVRVRVSGAQSRALRLPDDASGNTPQAQRPRDPISAIKPRPKSPAESNADGRTARLPVARARPLARAQPGYQSKVGGLSQTPSRKTTPCADFNAPRKPVSSAYRAGSWTSTSRPCPRVAKRHTGHSGQAGRRSQTPSRKTTPCANFKAPRKPVSSAYRAGSWTSTSRPCPRAAKRQADSRSQTSSRKTTPCADFSAPRNPASRAYRPGSLTSTSRPCPRAATSTISPP